MRTSSRRSRCESGKPFPGFPSAPARRLHRPSGCESAQSSSRPSLRRPWGILGRDRQDDVVGPIVVQRRTEKTADMIPKVKAAIDSLNHDGSLPPGVRVVPSYDRASLVALTTHTVLHNLIFGCLLVFSIQWIFLGNLRSAIIVGLDIPFALFFATRRCPTDSCRLRGGSRPGSW